MAVVGATDFFSRGYIRIPSSDEAPLEPFVGEKKKALR